MKFPRTGWLVLVAAILLVTAGGGAYADSTATASYPLKAKTENWDERIDDAIELWKSGQSISSYVDISVTPEAFREIYELGPDAVPYLLDCLEKSGENGGAEMFLMTAVRYNLHLYTDAGGYIDDSNPYMAGTAQYGMYNTRAFLEKVPVLVENILNSTGTDAQKLQELNKLGLAALPYLSERMAEGDMRWAPYLETQMLGLTTEERFSALEAEAAYSGGNASEQIYAHRLQIAEPVDASHWISANTDAIEALREIAC